MSIFGKITSLFLAVFTSTLLMGQIANSTLLNKTVLFKVTSPKSSKTSYLFGTHHAFGKSFFDSLTVANNALATCDLLIKENLNIPGEMAEDIINKRTTTTDWSKYLNKNDLSFVENLFATSPTDFQKMTPTEMYVFLNRYFKQQVCLHKASTDSSLSLDDYISALARNQNIELFGLETTEEQIIFINKDVEGMPTKIHKKRLKNILNIIRTKNTNYCGETDWYAQMDIDYKLDEPCTNALMLTDRNTKWIKSISPRLESNNCFIAVGLSHLMYECGLINQLQELGYTVTPILID